MGCGSPQSPAFHISGAPLFLFSLKTTAQATLWISKGISFSMHNNLPLYIVPYSSRTYILGRMGTVEGDWEELRIPVSNQSGSLGCTSVFSSVQLTVLLIIMAPQVCFGELSPPPPPPNMLVGLLMKKFVFLPHPPHSAKEWAYDPNKALKLYPLNTFSLEFVSWAEWLKDLQWPTFILLMASWKHYTWIPDAQTFTEASVHAVSKADVSECSSILWAALSYQ